ncbi:hypothetical protein JKF63_04174 [Porcisia hertigi]|uniref:Conserved oligomeric Golgi complex subunit 7 n=1 Tax=Porcisia hertigi TaxID=2761500 RepID=A0A836L816_9TRYP|nr:hypothetical protein JKF63_04174 [Porcisia hertigi]
MPLPPCNPTPAKAEVPGKPQPSVAPTATAPCTTPTSLSSDATARINTIIADDIRQLSRDDLNVKRWLNATLARVLEAAKDVSLSGPTSGDPALSVAATTASIHKPLKLEEHLVQLLHARVQAHSQELSAGIEDLISSTLVRLPRSTMELTRMATEAAELTEQLQHIQNVVNPTLAAGSETYVADLQKRKISEEKLHKCQRYLEKATRMQENIRNLQYLIEQRDSMATKKDSGVDARECLDKADGGSSQVTSANSLNSLPSPGKATTRERDLDEVADIIHQTREDLKEITSVDDTFGKQYKTQLEQFEQYIEHALEEECVTCLLTHQLERATRLMTTLYSIGRADAVLTRYGQQAAMQVVKVQQGKLRACVGSDSASVNKGKRAAAAVADLLCSEIIPEYNTFVSRELCFLSSLTQGTLNGAQNVSPSKSTGARASEAAQGTAASAASAPAEGTSGSGNVAVSGDPRAEQALEVISVILHKLYEPVQSTLQPLLTEQPDTTSADFLACISAIQLIKISTSVQPTTPRGTAAVEQLPESKGLSPASVTTTDPLEKLAREVTRRALSLFAGLFHEERVLERYVERVCLPVEAFCKQPLSKVFSAVPSTPSGDKREEDGLAHILTQAIQEVLAYAPEKITTQCTTAWHASLSKMLAQLQPTSSTSQHELLQHLYIYKHRMAPLLVKARQSVEDWLSSGTVHERCPTSAAVLCADLQTRVWAALKKEMEVEQELIQKSLLSSITKPILATATTYTSLSCWGNVVASDERLSHTTPVAAGASKALGGYTQGQAAPSSVVRSIGETLMELPLTLETLGSSAVMESQRNPQGTGDTKNDVSDLDAEEGVRALIEEYAEEWLETVVSTVVNTFIKENVLPLQIGPFERELSSPQRQNAQRGTSNTGEVMQRHYAAALEQLTTDLDYVRNILSAVNEESLETLERVLRAVQALPSASISVAFIVGDAIRMTAVDVSTPDRYAQ